MLLSDNKLTKVVADVGSLYVRNDRENKSLEEKMIKNKTQLAKCMSLRGTTMREKKKSSKEYKSQAAEEGMPRCYSNKSLVPMVPHFISSCLQQYQHSRSHSKPFG